MIAEVIVDITNGSVDKVFDYFLDESLNLGVGHRVLVPFGNRNIEGFIINIKDHTNVEKSKLKSVISGLDDFACLSQEMIKLMHFLTKTYNVTKASSIRLFLPSQIKKTKEKFVKFAVLTNASDNILVKNQKQLQILDYLKKQGEYVSVLNEKFSKSSLKTLIKNNLVKIELVKEYRKPYNEYLTLENKHINLTPEQENAVKTINENSPNTFLIHGVTASGKTEVYINVIEKALKENKTAILLVPEIGLTPQLFKRFKERFGDLVAILHSGLSNGERLDEWLKIKNKECSVVIGARSAIFAPLENLGIIIIDEEHDTSYFSETNPRYFTHEVAKMRAKINKCSLVLGSATPSVESYYKAQNGEYKLIEMKKRALNQKLPDIEIVDMCSELRNGNSSMFSLKLQNELSKAIEKNEQAIIFLNRRGYSSFFRCVDCGYIAKCDNCDVSLVYHKEDNQLKCHFCGNRYKALTKCPSCAGSNIRQGAVGTERIKEELERLFKGIKVFRMDNDTMNNKGKMLSLINEFNNTSPAILVGTQMVSKGHNFNKVSLVGIIDADLSLHFSDFRATDRTFNLLTQVAGRAGRSYTEGKVVLQTYTPRHYAYRCVADYNYDAFYKKEINLRKVTSFPPFSEIVRVLIAGENESEVKDYITKFYNEVKLLRLENPYDFIYLEAMKSPVKRVNKLYRYQVLTRLKLDKSEKLIQNLFEIQNKLINNKVSCFVERNPQNLS